MLGIRQFQGEVPDVPDKLRELMSADRAIFADFVVEPLAPYVPGVMQRARVVSASRIVVTEQGKVVLMKARL
jgi:hypothetical protein